MKRLITICAVVGLMLITTSASWAVIMNGPGPMVNPPPTDDPSWWNVECDYYAYGWWEDDLTSGSGPASPPDDDAHWASNFLINTDFTASVVGTVVSIDLNNEYRPDLYKEIYIYLEGTTTSSSTEPLIGILDTDDGVFSGFYGGSIGEGLWSYVVEGEIHPQPHYVDLTVTVPGLTSVINIWAGENCVPEPATIALLGLGALSLLRRKRKA